MGVAGGYLTVVWVCCMERGCWGLYRGVIRNHPIQPLRCLEPLYAQLWRREGKTKWLGEGVICTVV